MNDVTLRKKPKQARSLARFEAILDHAEVLIDEQGFESFKMNELARRADVNIASIYQYFPNRSVVARAIVERHLEQYRLELATGIAGIKAPKKPDAKWIESILDMQLQHYYSFLQQRPTFLTMWSVLRGNPDFVQLNMADSQANAEMIVQALTSSGLEFDSEALQTGAFLVCEITEPVMHALLNSNEEQAKKLLKQYKVMLSCYFQSLIL